MDNSRNINIKSLTNSDNINSLCRSFHEGIYSFTKSVSSTMLNYPENSLSGFLIINTDFEDKYCVQKITTMAQKFYYRTGTDDNGIMVWSDWDSFATLSDIPETTFVKNEKKYINKEEFLPKENDNTKEIYPDKELSSIMDEYYKYYGKYSGESIFELPKLINKQEGPYKDMNKKFIFGYFIKDEDDPYNNEPDRVPTGKAGLLQVFSSMFLSGNRSGNELPVIDTNVTTNSGISDIYTTIIFTEFETGDLYITRIFNYNSMCDLYDRYDFRDIPNNEIPVLRWSKYSYSKVRSYNLNMSALKFLKLRNRQFEGFRFTDINSIIGDYDNTRNEEYLKNRSYKLMTPNTFSISWNDEPNIALSNNINGIPFFNNNITDKDYSLITSLFPNGTSFKYPMIKNEFINTLKYNRPGYYNNEQYYGRFIMPIWNTFNLTYNTIKLTKDRYMSEEIEKEV